MMLAANGLCVQRGGRAILDQVSIQAAAGEFIAIVGANGAGKSTLLSVLAGLLQPDRGSVTFSGKPVADFEGASLARVRAYLPQNPRCEWPISVEGLVALGLTPSQRAFGGLSADDESRITSVLETGDLIEHRSQTATSLSGGELARAMLARAFVGDPEALIVDEPIAGLDPKHALDAMRRLKSFANAGKLVIAALHDLTLAARYTTRIVAMLNGRVESDGPVAATLTPQMIQRVFDVRARVMESGEGSYVDFIGTPG
jgi:iron complex transport system ATP-binding protein